MMVVKEIDQYFHLLLHLVYIFSGDNKQVLPVRQEILPARLILCAQKWPASVRVSLLHGPPLKMDQNGTKKIMHHA